jgi:hypothetical protein
MEQQVAERSRGLAIFGELLNRGKTPYLWSRAHGAVAQGRLRKRASSEGTAEQIDAAARVAATLLPF